MPVVGSGTIGPGGIEYYEVVLKGGVSYRIYVATFEPGVDFDVYVVDENSNIVSQDNSTSSDAICFITPKWTGPFRVAVKSARGYSSYRLHID